MSISDSTMSRFFLAAAGLMAVVGATPVGMAQGSFGPYVPTPTVIVDRLLELRRAEGNAAALLLLDREAGK